MEDLFRSLAAQQLMKRRQGARGPAQPSPPFQPPAPRPAAPAPTAGPALSPTMPSPAVPSPYLARRQQGSIGSSFPELSRR